MHVMLADGNAHVRNPNVEHVVVKLSAVRAVLLGLMQGRSPSIMRLASGIASGLGNQQHAKLSSTHMLFAYNEDGTLEVVADEVEARRQFDGHVVEQGAVRFFDAAGKPLTPRFPERSERKFLGFRISDNRGPFKLEASGMAGESLLHALGPVVVMMPNQWFADVDAVRAHLRSAPHGAR